MPRPVMAILIATALVAPLQVGAQDAARAGLVGTEERPVPEAESSYNPLGTKAQQDAELLVRTLVTASSIRAATASVGQI